MSILPFFSAFLLLFNSALFWIFKRFDQNLQKLQFWIMLTSGLAWLTSLAFFFLTPDNHLNPIWDAGEKLLPSLSFSLDWVSSSYLLVVTTLILFGMLIEGHSPRTSVLITSLGGICVIGTLVDSAYTLALVWTVIEALALYIFLKNQGEMTSSHRYILSILFRLTGPLILIYISVVNSTSGIAPFLTELPPSAAPYLVAAGVIGFGGWFLTPQISDDDRSLIRPGRYFSWVPAVLGLILITRSAQIFVQNDVSQRIILIGTILTFLVFLAGMFIYPQKKYWKFGSLIMIVASFAMAAPEAIVTWGMIFLLPGLVLFREFGSKRAASMALIGGGIGILPLPFFPAWLGLVSFLGIPGKFFSVLAGVFLGRMINGQIQDWRENKIPSERISPLTIAGYAVIVISQFSISIQAGLIQKSLAFSSIPISAWISALIFGVAVLFWDRIPEIDISRLDRFKHNAKTFFNSVYSSLPRLIDGVVYLFTRLFEGDGGLIWTLLLGFLIITLLSLRGG